MRGTAGPPSRIQFKAGSCDKNVTTDRGGDGEQDAVDMQLSWRNCGDERREFWCVWVSLFQEWGGERCVVLEVGGTRVGVTQARLPYVNMPRCHGESTQATHADLRHTQTPATPFLPSPHWSWLSLSMSGHHHESLHRHHVTFTFSIPRLSTVFSHSNHLCPTDTMVSKSAATEPRRVI